MMEGRRVALSTDVIQYNGKWKAKGHEEDLETMVGGDVCGNWR